MPVRPRLAPAVIADVEVVLAEQVWKAVVYLCLVAQADADRNFALLGP